MTANNTPHRPLPVTPEEITAAVRRFLPDADGTRRLIRFSTAQVLEHFLLMLAFAMLALTGLAQTYHNSRLGGAVIAFFGSVEAMRQVHHSWAWLLGLLSAYHLLAHFVWNALSRRVSSIWFQADDWRNFRQWLRFALGFSAEPVRFGRFTLAEKITYWLTVILLLGLGGSGLGQGSSSWLVRILPAWAIPLAHIVHRWLAIAAVWLVVFWHGYDVLVRRRNWSIFSGQISLAEMEQDHLAEMEYLRLLLSLAEQKQEARQAAEQAESLAEAAGVEATPGARQPVEVPESEAPEAASELDVVENSAEEEIRA
jgi:cytochrome b subunit of formate dehydrogenase